MPFLKLDMKTGDIILISGRSKQALTIQKFQQRVDKEAGKYNHSGIIYKGHGGTYVAEMGYRRNLKGLGRLINAALVFTPIEYYNKEYYLILTPVQEIATHRIETILFNYVGTKYDYVSLLKHQIVKTLTGLWIGRKKKAYKRMVCHEFTQKVWDDLIGCFPKNNEGSVAEIYHSPYFTT